jgi:phosphatidylserine/phosphatidylglycerophosphate/cardiolipin synthase-like enzyme
MKKNKLLFNLITTFLCFYAIGSISATAYGAYFGKRSTYAVCFTPGNACQSMILNEITGAQESIKIQAYVFDDPEILAALVAAKQRNIDVKVVVDKSQVKDHKNYPAASAYLLANHIPVWDDYKPPIAHNKVYIFDDRITLVGSYNPTNHALHNAENLAKINDGGFARAYLRNFEKRLKESNKL